MLVAVGIGIFIGHLAWTKLTTSAPVSTPRSSSSGSSSPGGPADAAALARATDPAVVDINFVDSYEAIEGAGTGMVVSAGGEVLTNNHVIEGATSITVTDVGNHHTYGATVVGYDTTQDVAVLQLTGGHGLHTVAMGSSSSVRVGDGVVAVGNAEGAGGTPSWAAGSVTALDQTISAQDEASGATEQLSDLVETNVDLVSGDSGGPLVNAAGKVVGMDTAASEGFQFQPGATQAYAIPIGQATTIASQIEARQSSATVHVGPTAFLGVDTRSPGAGRAGAQIVAVFSGTPAAEAGLSPGEIITAVDGRAVASPTALTTQLLGDTPGTTVGLSLTTLFGTTQQVTVQLASGPPQ